MLAFGLNNSLKAENKSFDGQDISLLFEMMDKTIHEMLPKERFRILLKIISIFSYITQLLYSYGRIFEYHILNQ